MKKAVYLFMALMMVGALAGCNVAPNVPGTSPYASSGTYATDPGYNATTPGTGNYLGRGMYGNNTKVPNNIIPNVPYRNQPGNTFGNNAARGNYGNAIGGTNGRPGTAGVRGASSNINGNSNAKSFTSQMNSKMNYKGYMFFNAGDSAAFHLTDR